MCDILRDILLDIKMCDILRDMCDIMILKCVIYYVIYYCDIKMCDIVTVILKCVILLICVIY